MYGCERWTLKKVSAKNWGFLIVVLQKTFESFFDNKDIKPVNSKGNQPWIFIKKTDAEAEAPKLWPPDVKSWLIEKTLMLGKTEGRRRRGWQRTRWLDGIIHTVDMGLSSSWDSEGQGSLVCCSPWGHIESDTTEWLNNNKTSVEYLWMFVKWTKHDYHNIYSHVFSRIFLNPRLGFIIYCPFCSQFIVHFVHNNNPLFILLDPFVWHAFHKIGRLFSE